MYNSGSWYQHSENFITYSNGNQFDTTTGFRLDWNYDIVVPVVDDFSKDSISQLYIK